MPDLFKGLGAHVYAFATRRISVFRDIDAAIANEVFLQLAFGTVLDVGAGPGYLSTSIAVKNPSLEVVGLDVSRDMSKIARASARRAHVNNLHVLTGDAAEIGMPNESVDIAVATLTFHHLSNQSKAFEELHRVLKTEGQVWIYEVNCDLTPQSETWMKGRYNIVSIKVARSVMKMLSKHTITAEHATVIATEHKNRFGEARVEQLEPLLVKIVLVKK
jgi:ubiquinone/menaquinone biosynthesis C-methylase UbiE